MFSVVRHTLLVVCTAVVIGTKAQPGNSSLQVTITSDPPDNTLCVNETVSLTCQVSNAAQPTYKWSSTKFNISDHSNSIKVIATDVPVQYYCNVFDASTNESGEAGITIYGKVMPPVLQRTNFEEVIKVKEGDSLNLTVEITSDLPLTGEPTWSRSDEPLSSEAVVRNFVVNKHNYTSLGLSNLSFANDSGNYSLTVKNLCGKSSLTVYIDVTGPKVCPPIDPVPVLLRGCVDGGAIVGNASFFQCSFEADYDEFEDLTEHYWTIQETNGKSIKVDEYSGRDDYSVMVDPDCPLNDDPCCKVTSELTISESSIDLNSALVMCYAGLPIPNHDSITSSAHLFVLVEPSLITPPGNLTIKKHANAKFQCHFRASTIEYVTIIKWFKDEYIITNTTKYQVIQRPDSQKDNVMFSVLNVLGVSKDDEGNYSCYCYYNETILDEFRIDTPVNTPEGVGVLIFQDEKEPAADSSTIIILSVSIGVCTIIVIIIVTIIGFTIKIINIRRSRSQDRPQNKDKSDVGTPLINPNCGSGTNYNTCGNTPGRTSPVPAGNQSMTNSTTNREVPFVPALSPPTSTEDLIGQIEVSVFDERGGVFHSYNHGATIIVPKGAISAGKLAELKFAATMVAPVKFLHKKIPVSAIFWICMDVSLKKPIQLRLPHASNNFTGNLQFAKGSHSSLDKGQYTMEILQGGDFSTGNHIGSIKIKHFCYYCIVDDNLDCQEYPHNEYMIGSMKQRDPKDNIWMVCICILPSLATCIKSLEEQYEKNDWEYETLAEFSCAPGCNQFKIEFGDLDKAVIKTNSKGNIIDRKDVDFYGCFDDKVALKRLKLRMDQKLYPPRIKLMMQATDDCLFRSVNFLDVKLLCGSKSIFNGIIEIPTYASNCSVTSGSESGTSTTASSEPTSQRNGKLNLHDLLKKTTPARDKWFEIGVNLDVPTIKLEKMEKEHGHNKMQCLVKVYRYWLDERNDLQPTPEKLQKVLDDLHEYSSSVSLNSLCDKKSTADVEDEPERSLVIKHPRLHQLLDLPTLIPVLNKYELLSANDNYTLQNPHIPPLERGNALIYRMLPTKGPGAFKKFIACLGEETEHSGHQEWVKVLKSKEMETKI